MSEDCLEIQSLSHKHKDAISTKLLPNDAWKKVMGEIPSAR